MTEMDYNEFVADKIRKFEMYAGPVDINGTIGVFKDYTITVHGKKETLVYTADDMQAYYDNYLTLCAGRNCIEPAY